MDNRQWIIINVGVWFSNPEILDLETKPLPKNSVTTLAAFSWHSLAVNLTVGIPSRNIRRLSYVILA
jgi:hypothetical protein